MLGRSYSISGTVAHGNERGRLLGYPTANIELEDAHVAVPLGGVYAVRVIVNGKTITHGQYWLQSDLWRCCPPRPGTKYL